MKTLIHCLKVKGIRLPKYLCFEIIKLVPFEIFHFGPKFYSHLPIKEQIRGLVFTGRIKELKKIDSHYDKLIYYSAIKFKKRAIAKEYEFGNYICYSKAFKIACKANSQYFTDRIFPRTNGHGPGIEVCARRGYIDLLNFLSRKMFLSLTVLIKGASRGAQMELLTILKLKHGVVPDFIQACKSGNLDFVVKILQDDPNTKGISKGFIAAVKKEYLDIMEHLLDNYQYKINMYESLRVACMCDKLQSFIWLSEMADKSYIKEFLSTACNFESLKVLEYLSGICDDYAEIRRLLMMEKISPEARAILEKLN